MDFEARGQYTPESGKIVAVCEAKGNVYVATEFGIYEKTCDKFYRLKFVEPEKENDDKAK